MYWKPSLACGFAAALAIVAVAAAPSISTVSTALEARHLGAVAPHFDQEELVKRAFNTAIVVATITTSGTAFAGVCAAFIAVSAPAGAAVCGAGAVAYAAIVIWANWAAPASTTKRDNTITDPRYWGNLVLQFEPSAAGQNTHIMAAMYNGTAPALVAYTDCETDGCYDFWYSNYIHPTLGLVHKVSQRPRGGWNKASSKAKRQTDEQAYEGGQETEDNGTGVYADWVYRDQNAADEMATHAGESSNDLADSVYTSAVQQSAFQSPGYYCANLVDETNGGTVDSTGYVSISENTNSQDPDNEASYLERCYEDEFARRRLRARRARV